MKLLHSLSPASAVSWQPSHSGIPVDEDAVCCLRTSAEDVGGTDKSSDSFSWRLVLMLIVISWTEEGRAYRPMRPMDVGAVTFVSTTQKRDTSHGFDSFSVASRSLLASVIGNKMGGLPTFSHSPRAPKTGPLPRRSFLAPFMLPHLPFPPD